MRESQSIEEHLRSEVSAAKDAQARQEGAAIAEMSQKLERVTRELEQARTQAEKALHAEQHASDAGVLRVALDDASQRCERLTEQLRKTEVEGLEIQKQLGDALNRCAAADERVAEMGEQARRQRDRADAADREVLTTRGELDRSLSKVRQLEADLQAQADALMDRQGVISAKVADLSEREMRLTATLEAERGRVAALNRELSGECCCWQAARGIKCLMTCPRQRWAATLTRIRGGSQGRARSACPR